MAGSASRDELLRRVDESWQAFADRLSLIAPHVVSTSTTAGWTGTAMLAHVAAWHDATEYRLRRFAVTRHPQPKLQEDDDRFNARVAAETAGFPADEVLAYLQESFMRLRSTLASMPPEADPDGWIEAVTAGNTFEHLPEVDALVAASGSD